jgi:putative serine protease PepD
MPPRVSADFVGMLFRMTDDQTTPSAAGGQSSQTSTTVGERLDSPDTPESPESPESRQLSEPPQFPVPPPPGPYVAGPHDVTAPHASVPGESSTVPQAPAGGEQPYPSAPSDPSAPFDTSTSDTPPAQAAVGAGDLSGWGAPPMPPTPPPAGPAPVGSSAPPSPSRRGRRAVAVLAAAGLVAGSAAGGALLALSLDDNDGGTTATSLSAVPASGSQDNAPDEPLSQAAAAVLPSVVSITFESNLGAGEGSGVIISSDGQILTNNHVVAQAADGGQLSVTFADGSKADARILGRDPATDLAVIKAEGKSGLKPAKLGSSGDLHVGDTVLAIGSPLGLEGSVSAGIVSALDRSITLSNDLPESPFGNNGEPRSTPSAVIDAIQTDAAINPGNSGGALINTDGEVVGINTAIASLAGGGGVGSQGGNIGVGFAIPIDSARSIAEQLVAKGEVTHAFLGVRITDAESGNGAVIAQLDDGQPAADAGLQQGDVITKVDDTEITSGSDLTSAIRSHEPGDKVTVTYTRDGDQKTAEVTLGELPTN